jgi:hypothetical protein
MHVESSLVNWGLKVNPSVVKKSTERERLRTGRFTKIELAMSKAYAHFKSGSTGGLDLVDD